MHKHFISPTFITTAAITNLIKPLARAHCLYDKIKLYLYALAFIFTVGCNNAYAVDLTIGVYDQKPDVYIKKDGGIGGILGEVLTEIARRENWNITAKACDWNDCLKLLASEKIDLLPDVYYTPQRNLRYSFHHIPALHSWSQIYARPGNRIRSINDLRGLKIATLTGSLQEEYLQKTLEGLNIQAELVSVKNLNDGFKQTKSLRYDAIAADFYIGQLSSKENNLVATPVIFQPTQAFYAAPKGKHPEILATLDRYLSRWVGDPESFYYQVLDNWRFTKTHILINKYGKLVGIGFIFILLTLLATVSFLASKLKKRTKKLQFSEKQLNDIINSIDAFVCVKDKDFRYIYANKKLADFYKTEPKDLIGKRNIDFLTDQEGLAILRKNDKLALNQHERTVVEHPIIGTNETKPRRLLTIKAPLKNDQGKVEFICTVATDITARLTAEETAHRLATYDPLTDLPNRKTAIKNINDFINKAREQNEVGALVQINLDGFKTINDLHGHYIGDQILCETAEILRTNTMARDLVARSNADEFIVILDLNKEPIAKAPQKAIHIAEKIWLALTKDQHKINDTYIHTPVSIGITLIHQLTSSLDSVMSESDMAITRAKEKGGNQIIFYQQDIQQELEERRWLEHDLSQAIDTDQLSIYLQPQFNPSGKVTGVELLSRWLHPIKGYISPNIFINIAEDSGLISVLGDWTIVQACKISKKLQSLGKAYPLSINICPMQLMDPNFTKRIQAILEDQKVPGNRFIFEITERVLINDIAIVNKRMHELSLLGIRFSIDDFGTGYSNLAYLKRMPVYELKIDKSLIQDIPEDKDSIAIAKMIIAMADQLDLRVVAEGVETEQQAQFLYINQCHSLQGYLLAKPMPTAEWLARESTSD